MANGGASDRSGEARSMAAQVIPFTGKFIDPTERQVLRAVETLERVYAAPQNARQRRLAALIDAAIERAEARQRRHPSGSDKT